MVNISAYADDLVLVTPSWRALQQLLNKLQITAGDIDVLQQQENCLYDFQTEMSV